MRQRQLSSDFNLSNFTLQQPPVNALPQRQQNQATTTAMDTTQPFLAHDPQDIEQDQPNINEQQGVQERQQQQQQVQRKQTASFKRRQRRAKQQNATTDNNRFSALDDDQSDVDSVMNENIAEQVVDEEPNTVENRNKSVKLGKAQKSSKKRLYLEPARMLRWFQDHAAIAINGRSNQAYVLASISTYDDWVRNNYELQVWQEYLKLGTNQQQWAKEVVQKTKKRDNVINTRFTQKKIARLIVEITKSTAIITDLQIQLGTYLSQQPVQTTAPSTNRTRDAIDRLEKAILKYIHHCTQHVGQMALNRVKLATAQLAEYKALKDFESLASPSQWNTHMILKPRIATLLTKSKNYRVATKRVEYDLPPKLISKINFSFQIDDSLLGEEDSNAIYTDMRTLTKEFRTQAMTLYLRTVRREFEIVDEQVKTMIKGMPKEMNNEDMAYTAFELYHGLREQRLNLEIEQAVLFLDEQRAEGESNNNEASIAPALARSLGEDFLLRL